MRRSKPSAGLIAAAMTAALLMVGGGTLTVVLLAHDDVTSSNPLVPSGPQWLVVRLGAGVPPIQMRTIQRLLQTNPGVLKVIDESPASYQFEATDQRAAEQVAAAMRAMPGVVSVTAR